MTKQRREGEANDPARAKTGQRKLRRPSWTEFVRLAHQAVVAIAGADRGQDLMAICLDARKGRHSGSHWSKPVRLHSA
jgi:hypothetical protein